MRLTFAAPFDPPRSVQVPAIPGRTLGAWCGPAAAHVSGCLINGAFVEDWPSYEPHDADQVTVVLATGISPLIGAVTMFVVQGVIATAISLALSYVIKALTPTPHPQTPGARSEGSPEQIYGIAGLTNTTAQGTPKLLCYGTRRVYGHILSTRAEVIEGGLGMRFAVLYFMGEGPVQAIAEPQINDIALQHYTPGVEVYTRTGGADNATLIHEDFATLAQVWTDGRQVPLGEPLVYQTKSARTTKVTITLAIPVLRTESTPTVPEGGDATMVFTVDVTSVAANTFVNVLPAATVHYRTLTTFYFPLVITLTGPNQWLFRVTMVSSDNAGGVVATLYHVMEEQEGDQRYPNSALMAFRGLASSQITAFDAMRGSALVYGLLVPVWNGTTFVTQWSNQRAWVLRHLLTDPRVGLGHRLPATLFDHLAAYEVQQYWDQGVSPDEKRDQCDLLVNDRRAAWDWVKIVLAEGRASLVPSNGMLKLVADRAGEPGLLYSEPGNIIEGSVTQSLGTGGGLIPNAVLVEFPDQHAGYVPQVYPYREAGTEGEPLREAAALTCYTFTHFAHAYWLARAMVLRQRRVLRRVTWQSPATALVSEPLDHVALSYTMPTYTRGVSGLLSAGGTLERLVLDRPVSLAMGSSYTLLLRHQQTNLVESRGVTTPAGTWGALTLSAPLDAEAAEGDLWAVGITNTALLHLLVETVTQGDELRYGLTASEYVPELYTYPAPPPFGDPGGTPFPPVLPPPGGGGPVAPGAPILSGTFGLSGTISLDWTTPSVSSGDSLATFQLYFSLGDAESWTLYNEPGLTTHFEASVATLDTGYFAVRAASTLAGWGPLSNAVYTDWT